MAAVVKAREKGPMLFCVAACSARKRGKSPRKVADALMASGKRRRERKDDAVHARATHAEERSTVLVLRREGKTTMLGLTKKGLKEEKWIASTRGNQRRSAPRRDQK